MNLVALYLVKCGIVTGVQLKYYTDKLKQSKYSKMSFLLVY